MFRKTSAIRAFTIRSVITYSYLDYLSMLSKEDLNKDDNHLSVHDYEFPVVRVHSVAIVHEAILPLEFDLV